MPRSPKLVSGLKVMKTVISNFLNISKEKQDRIYNKLTGIRSNSYFVNYYLKDGDLHISFQEPEAEVSFSVFLSQESVG